MKKIEIENGIDMFSWCPDIEEKALEQMIQVARQPFVKHIAIMPDAHWGQDVNVGSVVGCENVIVPNFVGSDCGCGMCAMLTSLTLEDVESEHIRKKLLHSFSRSIPVGFQHNSENRQKELYEKARALVDEHFEIDDSADENNVLKNLN